MERGGSRSARENGEGRMEEEGVQVCEGVGCMREDREDREGKVGRS